MQEWDSGTDEEEEKENKINLHNIFIKEINKEKKKREEEKEVSKRIKSIEKNDIIIVDRNIYSQLLREYSLIDRKDLYIQGIKYHICKTFQKHIENEFMNINKYSFINGANVLSFEELSKRNEDEQLNYMAAEDDV